MIDIVITSIISFIFGYCLCGLLAFDSDSNKFTEQYIKGRNEGYEQGYYDCYKCLMGDSTVWDGDEENV